MTQLIPLLIQYKYFVLFPLAAIEGPIIALVVGFMIYLGYFSVIPTYLILILGDLIPDTAYYYLGRFGNRSKLMEKYNLKPIEKLWSTHGRKTMFLSKLAYGLSTPFLISAGLVKMPFKTFISYAAPITLFQYAVILAIGYYMGHSYFLAINYIKYIGVLIALVLVVLVVIYILFSKYARAQLKKMEEEK